MENKSKVDGKAGRKSMNKIDWKWIVGLIVVIVLIVAFVKMFDSESVKEEVNDFDDDELTELSTADDTFSSIDDSLEALGSQPTS